jgi:hypothetical protein
MIGNMSASSDLPPEYLPPMCSPPPPYQVAMGKVSIDGSLRKFALKEIVLHVLVMQSEHFHVLYWLLY